MSGPGSGRYTAYVPAASPRNEMLSKLFNAKSEKGDIYGKAYQTDLTAAAAEVIKKATDNEKGLVPADGTQAGDINMFPEGVKINFSGAPDIPKEVKWKRPGDAANAYVPDLSSPGAGKTLGIEKEVDPKIEVNDIKPNYVPGAPDTGTVSPALTSPALGSPPLSIGKKLIMGKSSV